jgi:transposase
MKIPFKKTPVEFDHRVLFPTNVFDLLPEDHDSRVLYDLISQLDTSELEKKYSVRGQNAYHPKLICGILIYAYSQGVFSSRQIERKCSEDLGFMYISQTDCPNFRVLCDFRKNNHEFFLSCFRQTVALAMELGLASLGHVSIDGSKFKANTSKHKAMSYKRLKEKEEELAKRIEELTSKAANCDEEEDEEFKDQTGYEIPEELKTQEKRLEKVKRAKKALEEREEKLNPGKPIDDRKQISFADEDARLMVKNGNYEYAYNAQLSVDEDNQIIVGQHISQSPNDSGEVERALQEIEAATNKKPEKASLDNGYFSGKNLETLKEKEIDSYVAPGKGENSDGSGAKSATSKLKRSDFTYDSEKDCFRCPEGQELPFIKEDNDGRRYYQGDKTTCQKCPLWSRCSSSKKGNPRIVSVDSHEELRVEMRERMQSQEAKDIYKLRKTIVEPAFGQIKNLGFRGFSVRGLKAVCGEFSLMCIVHNLKKIAKYAASAQLCPEVGNFG